MAAADAGRIVCAHCGSNNFNTQAACWKCGGSLTGGLSGGSPSAFAPSRPASAPLSAGMAPASALPSPASLDQGRPAGQPIDPAVALWSAIALALFFPAIAIPVGLVFLMVDDQRRAEIGRVTLIWGIIFTVVQTLFISALMRPIVNEVLPVLKIMQSGRRSQPGMNDTIPSAGMPSGFQ